MVFLYATESYIGTSKFVNSTWYAKNLWLRLHKTDPFGTGTKLVRIGLAFLWDLADPL